MLRGALWPLVSDEAAGRAVWGVLGRGEAAAMGRWGAVGGSGRQLEAALGWPPGAEHVPVVGLLRMAQQGRDVHAHERCLRVLVHRFGGLTGPEDLTI